MANSPDSRASRTMRGRLAEIPRALGFASPEDWQKVLAFILVWAGAVVFALSMIDASNVHNPSIWKNPKYTLRYGYTYSLILLFLPFLALTWWYCLERKVDHDGSLRALIRAVFRGALLTAFIFVLFDALFASFLFDFPDANAVLGVHFWGYQWADSGDCSTLWQIYRFPTCYPRTIPIEEILFYLGGVAVLRGMYIWASEDFLKLYTLDKDTYVRRAKNVTRLLSVSWGLLILMIAILAVAFYVKRLNHGSGYPIYLLLQVVIISPPLVLLYKHVRPFINTRALLLVIVLQILISVIWEATAAIPYGWWAYKKHGVIGENVPPWSELPIEACLFWIGVGWSATFIHEATKIKVRSNRSWRSILLGDRSGGRPVAGGMGSSEAHIMRAG
jgi:hypothetical protein